jgi:hypothetical protein
LVLHGIGGWTIAEAKRRMSYGEFVTWRAYINKHGLPAQGSEATERAFAMLTWQVHLSRGGKSELSDWLPKPKSVHETQTVQMARMLGIKV